MSKPRWSTALVVLAFLVGCSSTPTPPTVTPTAAATLALSTATTQPPIATIPLSATERPTGTPASSATPLVTPTLLLLSPSATVVTTPAIPAEARLTINCLTIAEKPPVDAKLNGVIVLFDPQSLRSSLLNLVTGSLQSLYTPTEYWRDLVVSTDGLRMAAKRVQFDKPGGRQIADQLVVMAADGKLLKAISFPNDYWILGPTWLDDQRLLVQLAALDPAENADLKAASLLVINPFTGERRTLRPNFPDIYDQPYVYNWHGWGETAYDPTLTRVVYPRNGTPQGIPYVLWDVQKHVALAAFYDGGGPVPRWSPDGTHFAVASPLLGKQTGFELYLFDRDGRQTAPLTNFSPYYRGLGDIGDLSWSPDGRYIAFWLSTASVKQTPEHLAILDMTTDRVTDYCVPGTSETSRASDSHDISIVWSPNSQQLVVRYQPDENSSHTTLVDIVRGYAVQISDRLEPVGWLATP